MLMYTWHLSKTASTLDTEQDTVMGHFEKDLRVLL